MADFYKVLRKTVEALPVATGQARRSVYDRARMALGGQLDAMNPPLPPSEVSRQRLGLEDSIRAVEEDYVAGKIITNSERENAQRIAKLDEEEAAFRAQRSSRQVQEEVENVRRSAPVDDNVAFDVPPGASPQPRRREPEARQEPRQNPRPEPRQDPRPEPRSNPRPEPQVGRAPEPAQEHAPRGVQDPSMAAFDAAVESARSLGEPPLRSAPASGRREPEVAPAARERDAGLSRRRGRDEYYDAPSVDDPYMDEPAPEQESYYDDEPRFSAEPAIDDEPFMAAANDTRGDARGGRSRGRGADEYYDDRQAPYEPIRKKRRIWPWLLLLIILGGLGAGGYWAFQNQEKLLTFAEEWLDYGDGDVNPLQPAIGDGSSADGPRRVNANGGPDGEAQPATDAPKNDGRIIDDSGQMNPDVERGDNGAAVGEGVLPQSAILYEEGPTAEESRAVRGGTSWRVQEQDDGLPIIIGRVEVPARRLSIDLTIRKNEDASLSASHLVEMSFAAPPQAVGGGIEDVPALLLKTSEEAQGELMASVSVKVSDTLFWVALSSAPEDVAKNLELLGSRTWFDVPVRYKNGRRAIITLEKGREGDLVFAQALEAWNRGN